MTQENGGKLGSTFRAWWPPGPSARIHSRGNLQCQFVCVCVCLFVTRLTVSHFVHGPKTRYHRLLYDDVLDFDSHISLKRLCSRDTALFAYHGQPDTFRHQKTHQQFLTIRETIALSASSSETTSNSQNSDCSHRYHGWLADSAAVALQSCYTKLEIMSVRVAVASLCMQT